MASYGPEGTPNDIFLERTFLAGDFISGVGYGIQVVLYISCALYLWKQKTARKTSLYLLAYITLLFIVETIYGIVQARTVQVIYIDNRNYPGGPWQYFLATQSLPINVMYYATVFILTFLADILVLWRCWVIWTAFGKLIAYLVCAIPALVLLASFAMGILWTLQSSQPGLSMYSALPLAYGTTYYAISLGVNIVLTILITIRLLMYRRSALSTLPPEHAKHYVSLVAIFVESAALYSIFSFMFLVSYAVNNPLNQVFLAFASAAQQIASYLIIYRVAEGHAWSKDTPVKQTMPTMSFGAALDPESTGYEGTMTQQFSSEINTGDSPSPLTPGFKEGPFAGQLSLDEKVWLSSLPRSSAPSHASSGALA